MTPEQLDNIVKNYDPSMLDDLIDAIRDMHQKVTDLHRENAEYIARLSSMSDSYERLDREFTDCKKAHQPINQHRPRAA